MAIVRMTREERRRYNNMSQEEKNQFDEARRNKRTRASRQVSENELDIQPSDDNVLVENPVPEEDTAGKDHNKADENTIEPAAEEKTSVKVPTNIYDREPKKTEKEEAAKDKKDSKNAASQEDLSIQERLRRKEKEKKEVFINFMLDGTLSFSKIFVPVYRALEAQVKAIDEYSKSKKNNTVYYGLTVLHEKGEPVLFSGGYFTKDIDEILLAVRSVEFYGGSEDGREPINDGIETALRVLANNTKEYSSRGLIFLTDSKPDGGRANFTELPDMKYNNLRFVLGYLYDLLYRGVFQLVDGDGNPPANGKNEPSIMLIGNLLEGIDNAGIKEIAQGLLREVSVLVD